MSLTATLQSLASVNEGRIYKPTSFCRRLRTRIFGIIIKLYNNLGYVLNVCQILGYFLYLMTDNVHKYKGWIF